ncbi:hypothetical protein BU23DRAFT_94962 [Bimuria novae-zelandiae CBS 107.79]|uniref:SET domain-containing protein n=1 Tax=Bimuria novae-zelandiae CBS 107.79 TaxID=1447943 RepID=A0A6A5VBM1_9PLEO|nr:hypothetical protein BU23DRAFT_94962 [Bimuria novae-zelandiae CBS 107.79]
MPTQCDGILRTNSFSVGCDQAGVVIEASRINHACDNNSMHCWNDNLGKITVHAVRDIEKGEEITTNYIGRGSIRKERQAILKTSYILDCAWGLCSLPETESGAVDRKLMRRTKFWKNFQLDQGLTRHLASPLLRLRRLEETVRHTMELRSGTQLYEAYLERAALALAHSDLARGKIFFERAYEAYMTEHGPDDETAVERRDKLQNVSRSGCYGQSTRWKTLEADALPIKSISELFEDWLWKRIEDIPKPTQYADLYDRSTFLGIGGLPTKGLYDNEYHQDAALGRAKPRRHWCLMGRIMDSAAPGGQLHLMVTDVDGHITGVFFQETKSSKTRKNKAKKEESKTQSTSNTDTEKEESKDDGVNTQETEIEESKREQTGAKDKEENTEKLSPCPSTKAIPSWSYTPSARTLLQDQSSR